MSAQTREGTTGEKVNTKKYMSDVLFLKISKQNKVYKKSVYCLFGMITMKEKLPSGLIV